MRIKLSEEAYKLIHSLSSTEKAYFKKQGAGSKESNLVTAFDIINSSKAFDEEAISKKLKEKNIALRSIYKRLVPALLKVLGQYHHASTDQLKLNELENSVIILYGKNQLDLCDNLVEKGIRLARETKDRQFELNFLRWREKVRGARRVPTLELDRKNYAETTHTLDQIRANIDYEYLTRKAASLINKGDRSKKARKVMMEEVLDEMVFKAQPPEEYHIQHYVLLSSCYFFIGKWEGALQACKKGLDDVEEPDNLLDAHYLKYATLALNVCLLYLLLFRREEYCQAADRFLRFLNSERFRAVKPLYHPYRVQFELLILNELILSGKLKEALKKISDMRSGDEFKEILTSKDLNYLLMAEADINLLQTNYVASARILNTLLADSEFRQAKHGAEVARWNELICYYLEEDEDLFEARWLAQSRYVKKSDSGYQWENKLLKTLKNTFGLGKEVRQEQFPKLHQDILDTEKEELRTVIFAFDLLSWIESMAIGEPMAILIKEKYLGSSS